MARVSSTIAQAISARHLRARGSGSASTTSTSTTCIASTNRFRSRTRSGNWPGAIGLSEVAPDTLRRAHDVHPIAAVQSEYSLWTRNPELGLIQACAELGAILVAFSPLGRGYLSGLLQSVETFDGKDFRHVNPRFHGLNWRRNRGRLGAFVALANSWGLKPATLAIAWTLAKA